MERREVFQFKSTMSIPREPFIRKVLTNSRLSYDDMRVCLLLLTQINGWDLSRGLERASVTDPYNYIAIDVKMIAATLHMKKKDVKESLRLLEDEDILEKGNNMTAVEGYRFTF